MLHSEGMHLFLVSCVSRRKKTGNENDDVEQEELVAMMGNEEYENVLSSFYPSFVGYSFVVMCQIEEALQQDQATAMEDLLERTCRVWLPR